MESDTKTAAWANASSDNKRHQMTMKIADIAPHEAQLVDISERLSAAFSTPEPTNSSANLLDLDSSYLETARGMLATLALSTNVTHDAFLGAPALTKQQMETYLDFDPVFLDAAKTMLLDFIERMERRRK